MGLFFYNIFLILFKAGIRIAALFNIKARKWLQGRKGIWEKLKVEIGSQRSEVRGQKSEDEPPKIIWVHCASLGEFEQGRPVIEKLKSQYSNSKLLLTFFSPSGYEIRKDNKVADWVYYMPMDGRYSANRFLEIVKPSLVIFVKYEFWYYYLKKIQQNNIPLLLISALFRENSGFFKWYGELQRKMLSFFSHIFAQNQESKKLLDSIGMSNKCSISGDTRFDRVIEIAENASSIPTIEKFIGSNKTFIAGSTWPADEEMLQNAMQAINDRSLKLIIAPHEINKEHISQLKKQFQDAILYSELQTSIPDQIRDKSQTSNILIIDNIGMLSRLYKYAYITYVGGGFGKGIHNTLEAAVYGKPVLFGPAYEKYNEAIELINTGGAISISNAEECIATIIKLLQDNDEYFNYCKNAKEYVYANKGATEKILQFIQENRLLTN